MKRSIILLISLIGQVALIHAQPAVATNGLHQSTESATTVSDPHTPKATESPFYVKVYGLYGLLTPGVQINHSESLSQAGNLYPFKTTSHGLGAGARAGAGIGLIVNDFINVGIDADMLFGAPVKIDISYDDGTAKTTNTSTTSLKVVSVIPNITFKALSRPSFYIYNRLGLVGGVVMDYKTVVSQTNRPVVGVTTTNGTTSDYTKNSLALGYQAALGIQFRLSQAIRAFAEVVGYNQSFQPQRLETTTAGTNAGTPTTVVVEYKDQGIEIPTIDPKTRKPQTGQSQSFTVPMNSIGLGVGLTFRF